MNTASQRPGSRYWLITREPTRQGGRTLEIFTLDLQRSKVLPVFASEASAEWFLYHVPGAVGPSGVDKNGAAGAVAESGWSLRAVGAGELVSLLSGSAFSAGPCTGVEKVTVNPSPEIFERAGRDSEQVGESRGCFLEFLMGRGHAWFEGASRAESV